MTTDKTLPQASNLHRAAISFECDSAYIGGDGWKQWRFAARFDFDCPIALPRQAGDVAPRRKIPASRKTKTPLVLDVMGTSASFGDGLPLANVVTVYAFAAPGGLQLAAFSVKDEGEYSTAHKVSLWTDRGAVSENIEHLRFACPGDLDARLRDRPANAVTIVAIDAAGRTVLVETATGYVDDDYAVRVGATVVSFNQHPHYEINAAWKEGRYSAYLYNDRTVAPDPGSWMIDSKGRDLTFDAKWKCISPLVLDLGCNSPTTGAQRPLRNIATVHVFSEGSHLEATHAVKQDGLYYCTTHSTSDGTYSHEHLRIALTAELAQTFRADDHSTVTVVGLDAKGRTVLSELIHVAIDP